MNKDYMSDECADGFHEACPNHLVRCDCPHHVTDAMVSRIEEKESE